MALARAARPNAAMQRLAVAATDTATRQLLPCGARAAWIQARGLSMPSRALTRPFALESALLPCSTANLEVLVSRCCLGAFGGQGAAARRDKAARRHALSPLLPADALLRAVQPTAAPGLLQKGGDVPSASLALLAEQTLSVAVSGQASAWVLRGSEVRLSVGAARKSQESTSSPPASASLILRPGDLICLASHGTAMCETDIIAAASGESPTALVPSAFWLRCVEMDSSEVWSPIQPATGENGAALPHPSWVRVIFNEFGTHEKKL